MGKNKSNTKKAPAPQNGSGSTPGTTRRNAAMPPHQDPSIFSLVFSAVFLVLSLVVHVPCFLLVHSLSLIYDRPPKLVYWEQCFLYLTAIWRLPSHLTSGWRKLDLVLTTLSHTIQSPFFSLPWLLDEILYGRQLDAISIQRPVLVISAFRSASTQMARSLAQACPETLVAPNSMMAALPYLWLWRLATLVFGDNLPEQDTDGGITKPQVRAALNRNFSPEALARHDNDPFQLDTLDGPFLGAHLNGLAWQLPDPAFIGQEFNYATQTTKFNQQLLQQNFVRHVDRLARKTILFHHQQNGGSDTSIRFLAKGHFLSVAPQLAELYPDAAMVAVIRDPLARVQSGVNYLAVNPAVTAGKRPNFTVLTTALLQTEAEYCDQELKWFQTTNRTDDDDKIQRIAIPFRSFVKDPTGTLKKLCQQLDLPIPAKQNKNNSNSQQHVKPQYRLNLSLQDLGVQQEAYRERVKDYVDWMTSLEQQK